MLLLVAQWISGAGDTFTFLAIALKINDFYVSAGESARAMGAILIAFALPQLLMGLFAGTLVDRWDRKRTMIFSDLSRALVVPAFLLIRGPGDLFLACLIAFLVSTFSIFFFPARTALLPALVSEDELMTANGWMQVSNTMARLSGPVMAGIVVGRWGTEVAFGLDALSFVLSALLVMGIMGVVTRARAEHEGTKTAWMDLKEGIAYTLGSRLLQGVTLGIAIAMLGIGAVNVLLIPFLRHEFQASAEALGGLQTAQGTGMLVGGLILGALGKRLRPMLLAVFSMMILGAGTAILGAAPNLALIILIMIFVGLVLPPINASLQTMLQRGVPQRILGRAGSVMNVAISVTNLLAMGAASWLGDSIGLRPTFFLSGALVFLGGLAMGWILRGSHSPAVVEKEERDQAILAPGEAATAAD